MKLKYKYWKLNIISLLYMNPKFYIIVTKDKKATLQSNIRVHTLVTYEFPVGT